MRKKLVPRSGWCFGLHATSHRLTTGLAFTAEKAAKLQFSPQANLAFSKRCTVSATPPPSAIGCPDMREDRVFVEWDVIMDGYGRPHTTR